MTTTSAPIDVYWRPGCGTCSSLRIAQWVIVIALALTAKVAQREMSH